MPRSTVLLLAIVAACGDGEPNARESAAEGPVDSAFAALQERGAAPEAMGVDQYTSAHVFDDLPDGGRIELQRQLDDPAGVEQIRQHLREVAQLFSTGDFRIPGFVHDRMDVPGTTVMSTKRDLIRYEFSELPRGGQVRIYSNDPEAIAAIHAFLAFQRMDHRAAGHSAH